MKHHLHIVPSLIAALLGAACGGGSDDGPTGSSGGGDTTGGSTGSGVVNDPALEATIKEGLESWRKPGVHGACAGCHSPDGIDIASINYDEATIRRRAQADQMEKPDEDAIVGLISAIRKKYVITPVDRITFRPFQPGGELIGDPPPEGVSDTATAREERDRLFLASLKERKLKILDGVIDSVEEAQAVADELAAIDLRDFPVGIPFDRWSEDPFNTPAGLEPFKSVAEWVPGLAQRPKPGKEAEWYAIVDAYLAAPSDEANFWAFYDAVEELTEPDPLSSGGDEPAVGWMRAKYKSVQIGQHTLFREKSREYPDVWFGSPASAAPGTGSPTEDARDKAIERNPIWAVGDRVRVNPLHCTGASACMHLPDYVDVPDDEKIREIQTDVVQQSWFWTAWEYDPALLIAGEGIPSIDGDYFLSTLMNRYAIHHAFLVAKGMVSKATAPAGWLNAKAPDRDRNKEDYNAAGHGKWASYKPFLLTRQLESTRHVVGDEARQPDHTLMMTNSMRMAFYLMKKELEGPSPTVYDKEGTIKKLTILKGWFNDGEWDDPAYNTGVDPLIDELIAKIKSAGVSDIKDPSFEFPDVNDIQ